MGAPSHLYISRTVDTATLKGAGRYTPDSMTKASKQPPLESALQNCDDFVATSWEVEGMHN